jgi:hypothetical protein
MVARVVVRRGEGSIKISLINLKHIRCLAGAQAFHAVVLPDWGAF